MYGDRGRERIGEEYFMYQIVRIKQIRKSGINAIGGEEWREN